MTSINTQSYFQPKQNPNDYAKKYAQENGLSLSEAKQELKTKYGEPQEQTGSLFTQDTSKNLSENIFSFSNNPDEYAQIYSELNNISLEDAKCKLKELYGEPKENNSSTDVFANGLLNKLKNLFNFNNKSETNTSSSKEENNTSNKTEYKTNEKQKQYELIKLGIPNEVIIQGDDAIRKFAEENNIEIPQKSNI